ncbi:hypothetical protein D3C78_1414230 [compost metagenome]
MEVLAHNNPLNTVHFAAEHRLFESLILPKIAYRFFDAEFKQQFVFQAYEKYGSSRVALAARTPAQLVVDPHALVHMRTNHVQTAQFGDSFCLRRVAAAELNVDAASCHIRRHRHGADFSRFGDDPGFFCVVFCIQNMARYAGNR